MYLSGIIFLPFLSVSDLLTAAAEPRGKGGRCLPCPSARISFSEELVKEVLLPAGFN